MESIIFDEVTTSPNTDALIIANESKPSENLLSMCSLMWQHMPEYMEMPGSDGKVIKIKIRPELEPQYRSTPSRDRMIFDKPLSSRIFLASSRSIDAYLGYQFHLAHASEASRYADGHELFRAVYPTLAKDVDSALFIESTPNGQEGRGAWFYGLCMDAAERKGSEYGEFALVFIPWHKMTRSFAVPFETPEKRHSFEKKLNSGERDILKRFPHVSLEQLLYRRLVLAGFKNDEDMYEQEYPSDLATAFLMTGTSVFSKRSIRYYSSLVREPHWVGDIFWGKSDDHNRSVPIHDLVRAPIVLRPHEAKEKGFKPHTNEKTYLNLKVWRWPARGDRLFLGADVGGGNEDTKDGDESTVAVVCMNELNQDELLMTWRGHLNPLNFGEVCAALAWYCRDRVGTNVMMPELAPEFTGPGKSTCDYIDQKKLYPLYRYQVPGVEGKPKSKHVGWESNAKTKPIMVDYTLRHVEKHLIDIPDKDVVLQMSSYRQKDDYGDGASYGGASGRHDDLVTALQIAITLSRWRSSTHDPEAFQVTQMSDGPVAPGEFGFDTLDPYHGQMPGLSMDLQDVDDEALEEAAFFAGGDADYGGMEW